MSADYQPADYQPADERPMGDGKWVKEPRQSGQWYWFWVRGRDVKESQPTGSVGAPHTAGDETPLSHSLQQKTGGNQ
jgi:hypothetical protein